MRELDLEEKRYLAEERRAEREAAERQAEREAEERKAQREERRAEREAQMQLEQAKLAHEIRMLELQAGEERPGDVDGDDGPTPRGLREQDDLV